MQFVEDVVVRVTVPVAAPRYLAEDNFEIDVTADKEEGRESASGCEGGDRSSECYSAH